MAFPNFHLTLHNLAFGLGRFQRGLIVDKHVLLDQLQLRSEVDPH